MTGKRGLGRIGPAGRRRLSRWYLRVPLKWLVLLAVTFLVLFPSPRQLARHVSHMRNLEAMVEPDAPELAAWDEELRQRIANEAKIQASTDVSLQQPQSSPSPQSIQRQVEKFVYQKVKYKWDWDVWGSADYMPTVGEMFAKAAETADGRIYEDCDGRAVMAASLMRRLGYDSAIVTDLRHVWVTTPQGEWMGPGRKKTLVSTAGGNKVDLGTVWSNVPVSLSYGVSVFPLVRELIILATVFVLVLHRRMSWRAVALGGVLLLQGLLFMRCGVLSPRSLSAGVSSWPAVIGIVHVAAGIVILCAASHRARRVAVRNRR